MHVFSLHCNCIDPYECQDGVTNNCSQGCTRNKTISNMTLYICACDVGFAASHFGYCEGKNLLIYIAIANNYANKEF